jgi:heptosyltransferase III
MFRRNVLIFHTGALGDFVLTFPLALGLGRLYPQSRIIYVTHGQKGKLAEAVLGVESADIEGGWRYLFSDPAELPPAQRRMLEHAHAAVFFAAERDAKLVARMSALDIQCIPVDPRPPAVWSAHVTEWLLEQLVEWPAVQSATRQMVKWLNGEGLRVPREAGVDVLVHPGSGGRQKCWPAERYAALVEHLRGRGLRVAAVLGEVECERMTAGEIGRFEELTEVYRPGTYCELLRHLLGSHVFVGNDSGPGHLAGVLGLPALCLYGPTDPQVWRPLGPRVRVLREQPLGGLTVERVQAVLAEMMG